MYAEGGELLEDYVQAHAWLNLAAAQGHDRAFKGKDLLRPRMTAELFNRIETAKS